MNIQPNPHPAFRPLKETTNGTTKGAILLLISMAFQGCAFYAGDYRFGFGENIQANLYVADPEPAPYYEPYYAYDYYVPDVVIVENGIRHDHHYYQRHPESYHRDRARYPEHFSRDKHHYSVPYGYPAPKRPSHSNQSRHENSKSGDKRHDGDGDHNR